MVEPLRTIGEHGIIGDLETAALVARDGTIDYLCWPALDSPTIFADLLHPGEGGAFTIEPELDDPRALQLYIPDTNVLVTRWMADEASVELVDLMPHPDARDRWRQTARCLIRRITVTRGTLTLTARCAPRFDYARAVPQVATVDDGVRFSTDTLALRLYASVPLECADGAAGARFTLKSGESAWFILGEDTLTRPDDDAIVADVTETIGAWRRWLGQATYKGRWREQVLRSALTLKLLTSAQHGSIAAAATFSLPEASGAGRNWDYRATWIRDASFTVYAFMRLGFVGEAEHFRQWASQRVMASGPDDPIRIMYAIDGSEALDESELPHFAGYADSRPVRIGNAAHAQSQLDIFGELLDSVYLSNKYGAAVSHDGWQHVCGSAAFFTDRRLDPADQPNWQP